MLTKQTDAAALQPLISLYDLHSNLFLNVTDGISETDSNNRLDTKANHPSWIAGSIVHQRYDLLRELDASQIQKIDSPDYLALFQSYQGIKPEQHYPQLNDYADFWNSISPVLKETLNSLALDRLNAKAPFDMGEPITYFEAITFMIHREAYCIGQVGLWRRLLGYEAMKYQ